MASRRVTSTRMYAVEMSNLSLEYCEIVKDFGHMLQLYVGRVGFSHNFAWISRAEAAVFIFRRELPEGLLETLERTESFRAALRSYAGY